LESFATESDDVAFVTHLDFDPIWCGIIIVMTVELGLIHPPVGMNVFVIKSVVKDPFVLTDLIRLVILITFPLLATWLPARMAG
jgi:C4-dicarboxylate transporter, DctM subunit